MPTPPRLASTWANQPTAVPLTGGEEVAAAGEAEKEEAEEAAAAAAVVGGVVVVGAAAGAEAGVEGMYIPERTVCRLLLALSLLLL